MGTVHGVYLKYVGLSALSYIGYTLCKGGDSDGDTVSIGSTRSLMDSNDNNNNLWWLPAMVFGYSTIVNGVIAILFKMEKGMEILGKNKKTGEIPLWSYIVFFPFHIPTYIYTYIHTKLGLAGSSPKSVVPVATQVQDGWYVGGCFGSWLPNDPKTNKPIQWGGIIDVTVEFPEACKQNTKHYLSLPAWDGVPATPAQLEQATEFARMARKEGPVLVHCAHGRGRSTTIMCACLTKIGMFANWQEAFEKGIKPHRSVCKLNSRMKQNLQAWQEQYMANKKVQ